MNTVYLQDAYSSSDNGFQAENVLARQNRILGDSEAYLHAALNNEPWTSSCAVTTGNEATSVWGASFTNGAADVAWVQVRYAEENQELLDGAVIYIGDTVCGTVDLALALPEDNTSMYSNIVCGQCTTDEDAHLCPEFSGAINGQEITIQKAG